MGFYGSTPVNSRKNTGNFSVLMGIYEILQEYSRQFPENPVNLGYPVNSRKNPKVYGIPKDLVPKLPGFSGNKIFLLPNFTGVKSR